MSAAGLAHAGSTNSLRAGVGEDSSISTNFWAGALQSVKGFASALTPTHLLDNLAAQAIHPDHHLLMWLRADKGVVTSGSNVTQWLDQSGHGNHTTGVNGTPTFATTSGHSVIRINAASLDAPDIFPVNSDFTVAVAFRRESPIGSNTDLFGIRTLDGTARSILISGNPGDQGMFHLAGADIIASPKIAETQNFHAVLVKFIDSGTMATVYLDGIAGIPTSMGSSNTNPTIRIGQYLAGVNNTGDIAEVMLFKSALSDAEAKSLSAYLLDKYSGCQHGSKVLTYTGANQSFTVPAGCTKITAKLWGAGGGGATNLNANNDYPGGAGGYTEGTLSVTAGTLLSVVVGGGGNTGATSSGTAVAITGGFGGGGIGYTNTAWGTGGGGGRSAVCIGATICGSGNADLLTAGGGGGGVSSLNVNRFGGAGGGLVGSDGGGSPTVVPGKGGTQSAGGAGGDGNVSDGSAGTAYQGGDAPANNGAGGGGGRFGGGGGGVSNNDPAGGGGGSGFVGAAVINGSTTGGSGVTPGNATDPDRRGFGVGGAVDARGGHGAVVIYY